MTIPTLELLGLGTNANDGTGDSRRDGGLKLNRNLAVTQVHGKTLNAGYFAYHATTGAWLNRTAVQVIQAAIDYAVANSYTAVWIPIKVGALTLLPYDASAVTFNTGVHMMREGGNSDLSVYEPEAYGATAGSSDDVAALFAVQAAAQAGYGRIEWGSKTYKTSQPFTLTGTDSSGIKLRGVRRSDGTGGSSIQATYPYGPVIVGAGAHTFPVGASLLGGTNSFAPSGNTRWLQLRECAKTLDLNGLSAFTAEWYFQPGASTGDGTLAESWSIWFLSDSATQPWPGTFTVFVASGTYTAKLRTSGSGVKTISSGVSMTAGVPVHMAITYDGSTFTFWIGGSSVGTPQAMTGTLLQQVAEEVLVGMGTSTAPVITQGSALPGGANSLIGPIRFSNSARYTTGFTPPGSFTNDANTLLLLPFTEQLGPCTKGQTKDGDAWLPVHQSGSGIAGARIDIEDLTATGSIIAGITGMYLCGQCYRPNLKNFRVGNFRNGVLAPEGNIYGGSFDVFIDNNGVNGATDPARYGIVLGPNAGLNELRFNIYGSALPFYAASGVKVSNGFVQCLADTVVGAHFGTLQTIGAHVVDALTINTESGVSASWRAGLAVSGKLASNLRNVSVFNGLVVESANNVKPILIDNPQFVQFNGLQVASYGSAASVVQVLSAPTTPIKINGIQFKDGTVIPLSDMAGTVLLGRLGKLTAIAFSTPLTLDCSLRDDFELAALTGAITINFSNVTPGQKISLWTVQNAGGGNSITFGTVNGTGVVKGATANDTTGLHYSQYLFDANLNGNLTMVGFSSGA